MSESPESLMVHVRGPLLGVLRDLAEQCGQRPEAVAETALRMGMLAMQRQKVLVTEHDATREDLEP